MFISPGSAEEVARQLASIAQHYRFEGWLINIENMIQQHAMPNLLHFIRQEHCPSLPLMVCQPSHEAGHARSTAVTACCSCLMQIMPVAHHAKQAFVARHAASWPSSSGLMTSTCW